MRLDQLLVQKGLIESREKAKSVIMSGIVYVNNQKADKAGQCYDDEAQIEVRGKTLKYVSRGGLKLEKALEAFQISVENKVCIDIGASTGGFTDCMLLNGALKVYAVDVGYGQLAWTLRTNARVVNIERTNIRYLDENLIKEKLDFCGCDVSFISLKHIFPICKKHLKENAEMVFLIKPQFEAGREKVGKNGVVREIGVHQEVIKNVIGMAFSNGFSVCGLDYSPVKGPKGNMEFLLYLKNTENEHTEVEQLIKTVTEHAHSALNGGSIDED